MSVKTHLFVFEGIIEVYLLTTERTYSRVHTKLRSPLLIRPGCWYVPPTDTIPLIYHNRQHIPKTIYEEIRNCFVDLNHKEAFDLLYKEAWRSTIEIFSA